MENWIDSDDVHYEFEGRRKHSNSPGGRNTILIPPAAEYHNGPMVAGGVDQRSMSTVNPRRSCLLLTRIVVIDHYRQTILLVFFELVTY